MKKIVVACIQLRSGCNVNENLNSACKLIREAVNDGAEFVATPEMTSILDKKPGAILSKAMPQEQDIALSTFRDLAEELSVPLLIGSLPILLESNKCSNRSFLISSNGEIIASYDKIHMFDVDLGGGNLYKESETYKPGQQSVLSNVCGIPIGMTICYDLRFPHLYQDLAKGGAKILAVPAAFTKITGGAHWHVLLRARAIETGCFVIAPAQGGIHEDGRETFGHSIIINPWGEVISEMITEPGYILGELDMPEVDIARQKIPALNNFRNYHLPV